MIAEAPFRAEDGGRSTSKRPRQRNDCTVRALAVATGVSYDAAYDELKAAGRKASRKFRFREWASKSRLGGCAFAWEAFPAVKGQKRMNPERFCRERPHGTYILKTAKHVFAVVDGVVIDEEPVRADRCVYGAWRVVPADR
ncbi:hypothetical protein CKO28_24095 [Rhodovibrio sodomensis]|uniref:Uncharacterized protein n=1 Tax=Rhodovibrio sodomensis TaxID=1088 RepID=A0ABS1DMZ3_9PROT|nr:hypothetical protein [Rhodovibrio sodomensis]MBK1671093.1 hypothetical protein [Rhodovibrio sodomensis]